MSNDDVASNPEPEDPDYTARFPQDDTVRFPQWLRPLVRAARAVTAAELTRFTTVPDGVNARESAVLIALSETEAGPSVLLMERSAQLREHAGQVSFPGGGTEPHDRDAAATALREAAEEVGVRPSSIEVAATLAPLFLPPSAFLVTPVLGWWRDLHEVGVVSQDEVAKVANVPIAQLADPANRFRVVHPSGFKGPGFEACGLFVWGFTGGLVDAVLRLGGWYREWDTSIERAIP